MRQIIRVWCVIVIMLAFPAMAQDSAGKPVDMAQRLDLAKKMHEIRPAKVQIEAAVEQLSQRIPPPDRPRFKDIMMKSMDFEKLDKLSVETMAEVFTAPELERMVGYFGSAEAASISQKMPVYQSIVQPEIAKMVDAAMMSARTGSSVPGPQQSAPPSKQ
ncbi:MAG: hypothetical protein HY370_02915 [Proteobacteria bacterium]|nr:hypothetical protein [Pseudomonadota bacterium]